MACIKLNFNVDVNKCLSGLKATMLLSRPKSGVEKLEREMTRLRGKRDDVKNQIDKEEREGKVSTNEVNQWLHEVEELESQVNGIKLDFQSMSCFSCNCFNLTGGTSSQTQTQQAGDQVPGVRESSNCCSIIRRVATKLSEANELMSQAGALNPIATFRPLEPTVMLPNRPPVGIESYVKDIVSYIDSREGNVIGIYGMGGVGKTTVLKSVRQHYLLKHTIFYCVIWVVASKDCQLKRLQTDIAKSLSLQTLQETDDERTCGDKLFSYLKNKNCLLLLDDIWECLDLQLLGLAHPVTEPGQQQQLHKVVVFTTRSETVCVQMEAKKKMRVKCLDPNEAWQLFKQNSDKEFLSSDGGINFVAQELVRECAGLPLALITVGRAMSGKKSWEAWNAALHQIKDKHEWTTIGLPKDSLVMCKAFKLSYDSLENDSIRECLLCCALWPEDYEIHKFEYLIPCWIGCGIIREFNVINEAFTKGYSQLDALMAASLLEHCDGNYVKMHDVIRDMALLMVSGLKENKRKWIVKAGIGLSRLPRQEEWQDVERASFMSSQITSLQDYGASTFPKLSMLLLNDNDSLTTIPPSLFASMPRLTYLDLSRCGIRELPMEIGSLTELQYLNLFLNPITTLPAEFGSLGKLEYLLLRDTELKTVSNGTISNLLMLKWLDLSRIYPIPEWSLDELKRFKGRHQLSVGIEIHATTDNIERLNMLPNVSIWELIINGNDLELSSLDLGTPQWSCNVSDNLEHLSIASVALDKLMFAAGASRQSSFGCLKSLHLANLRLLEKILLNGVVLRNLRGLYIYTCWMLKDVSWIQYLPCLNHLEIGQCPEMTSLIISDIGNSNSSTSSSIQSLTLSDMKNFNCIANPPFQFPYLEHISVRECRKLRKLPFETKISKSRLKKIEGEQNWWDNLKWKDESIKNFLTPHFIPKIGYYWS